MINYFAILLSHGLIAYVCYRLMLRDDLDDEGAQAQQPATGYRRHQRDSQRDGARARRSSDSGDA